MTEILNPAEMRNLILNSREPILFKETLTWNMLNWDLNKWENEFNNEELVFRCGKCKYTEEPQWERTTEVTKGTFKDLMCNKNENEWLYFDYKYLREWLLDKEELRENISWKEFGFSDENANDSTIWIGTKYAHTPCHIDTYGCNLIAQVFGRKRWILFPPTENVCPSRVPYEESSIFSKLNFFIPNLEHFKNVGQCRTIILDPGDVLFVPNGWWHYVENLDLAISVNVWLPRPKDDEMRLEESIVQMLIAQFSKRLTLSECNSLLNPNSDTLNNQNFRTLIDTIEFCLKKCQVDKFKKIETKKNCNSDIKNIDLNSYLHYKNIKQIPILSQDEFLSLLQNQKNRFKNEEFEKTEENMIEKLINAITHPEVIHLIKTKLLKSGDS